DGSAVTIAIRPRQNTAPVADAGEDQEVHAGDLVQLDGSGSSDAEDGTNLTYEWTVLDDGGTGLTTGDLEDADTATPTFVAPSVPEPPGEIVLQLEVEDADGATDTDTVTITVLPPAYDVTGEGGVVVGGSAGVEDLTFTILAD